MDWKPKLYLAEYTTPVDTVSTTSACYVSVSKYQLLAGNQIL